MADSYHGNVSPTRTTRVSRRLSAQKDSKKVDEMDLAPGRVFWLPPREELPPRAVRRAHGKGAIEEGIYNHPVLVVSRPADEPQVIHFHIVCHPPPADATAWSLTLWQITSFQGKRLGEIYSKTNEFHASRRSWYLPIHPSPDHPDANSKKTKKRFPTLELAGGATLRWDSYVNLRHVYKIEWAHLKAYWNPELPERTVFRFDRESMARLLAKTKTLTNYEPGEQYQFRGRISPPVPHPPSQTIHRAYQEDPPEPHSPADSVISSEYSSRSPILQSDFGSAGEAAARSTPKPPKAPPDRTDGRRRKLWRLLRCIFLWPLVLALWLKNKLRRRRNRLESESPLH